MYSNIKNTGDVSKVTKYLI